MAPASAIVRGHNFHVDDLKMREEDLNACTLQWSVDAVQHAAQQIEKVSGFCWCEIIMS